MICFLEIATHQSSSWITFYFSFLHDMAHITYAHVMLVQLVEYPNTDGRSPISSKLDMGWQRPFILKPKNGKFNPPQKKRKKRKEIWFEDLKLGK